MVRWPIHSAFLALTLVTAAHAQTDALQVKRQAELRQTPSDTGASVATLPAQATITRLPERQGPWMRVKTESGQTGWIHMFDVGSAAAATTATGGSAAGGALRGLTNFFSGGAKSTTTTATSTIGIRGLGSEDIANSQPNMNAIKDAEALRMDATQAKRFGADAQLATHAVDPLPAPAAPASANNAGEANSPFGKMGGK